MASRPSVGTKPHGQGKRFARHHQERGIESNPDRMRIHKSEDLRLALGERPSAHAGIELTGGAQTLPRSQFSKKTASRIGKSTNHSGAKTVQSKLPGQIGLRRFVHFRFQIFPECGHGEKNSLASGELPGNSKPTQLAATSQRHARPRDSTNLQTAKSHLRMNQGVAFGDRSFCQSNKLRLAGANFLGFRSSPRICVGSLEMRFCVMRQSLDSSLRHQIPGRCAMPARFACSATMARRLFSTWGKMAGRL